MLEWRHLRAFGLALTLAAGSHAAIQLEGTPFEQQTAQAFQRQDSLRSISKTLAAALEGTASDPAEAQAELVKLPVNQPTIVALGQAGLAAALEAKLPGSGVGQVVLASRMAGNDFGVHWMIVLGMTRAHSPAGVSSAVTGLEASMLSQGWQRLPEASAWLLNLANEANSKAMEDTLRLCAQRLDPISPVPAFARAKERITSIDIQGSYDALRLCVLKILTYPQNQLLITLNALRALRMVGLIGAFFLFIGWMVRYWPWVAHKSAEHLPQDSSIYLRYGVLAVGFLSILLTGVGAYAFFLFGSALLWKYMSTKERGILGALILFIGSQGFIATTEEILARHFDLSSKESLQLRSAEEGFSPQLAGLLLEHPEPVAQSTQALKAGDLLEAGRILSTGAQDPVLSPLQAGNIAFVHGAIDSAGRHFSQAYLHDAANPILPFNRGQVASAQGHTDSLNPLLKSASIPGALRFDLAVSQNSRLYVDLPSNRMTLPPELSPQETWARVGVAMSEPTLWLEGMGSTGSLEIPFMLLPWASLTLLIWLIYTSKPRNLARDLFKCKTCGRVMCRHCRRGLHCISCFRRLSTVNELELRNELLMRLEKEGQQRERLLLRALDLALPGIGSFAKSPSLIAIVKMLLLALSLSLLLNLPGFITRYPFSQSSPGKLPFVIILAVLYGINTFITLRHTKRIQGKG